MRSKEKVNIKTKEALDEFLNVLAEESVTKARRDLRYATYPSEEEKIMNATTEKRRQSDMSRDLESLRKSWGNPNNPQTPDGVDEDDEDVFAAIAKAAGDEPSKKKKKKSADDSSTKEKDVDDSEKESEPDSKEEPEPSDDAESADDQSVVNVTFTMIRDKLNTIRSGRSLRDRDIKDELKSYVMKLDGEERGALHAFLDGIGQILTAGIESEEAQEPSDDPYDIEMEKRDEPKVDEPKTTKKSVKKPVDRKKQRSLEDTTAPIQVGKTAQTESFRRKIRELMGN